MSQTTPKFTGAELRQSFIDFFLEKGHTFVASSSLVPGGDQTLLFTNAGMVQFKDVFLGTDERPYKRAVNSQKCMRVAGKHNDLDDVGRDDTHHTFFEMLGNWSFGDYYKKEAIAWAWELLTDVWKLPKEKLWVTYFKDDRGIIETDLEAAENWKKQPGLDASHIIHSGRKDNFWEMAEVGPCGPCSEIHYDRGAEYCDKKDVPGHVCRVNGDCIRYMELWNLVFIQYNRLNADTLEPLPARHVDTGMGFDRIVSVIQNVPSNYRTDLFSPMMEKIRELAGQTAEQQNENITPYRVIADHARSCAFLIADGVVPGNTGRNYVCRMIIRRASRFGSKIGLNRPFLAEVSELVVRDYGKAFPELEKNRKTILENITREEKRFHKTVEAGMERLDELFQSLPEGKKILDGHDVFEMYATHGLPLEITRDIARERGFDVDVAGFTQAMEDHRVSSGAGKAFGKMGGEDVEFYRAVFQSLKEAGKLTDTGVRFDPYSRESVQGEVLAVLQEGEVISEAGEGCEVEIILPETCFYIESGGQVGDTGLMTSINGDFWKVEVNGVHRPAAGILVHSGVVKEGCVRVGDLAQACVDPSRRMDIRRNHTATHLLHKALHEVLGEHARQAGSLVAPDRLRFDFAHPEAMTPAELDQVEAIVNRAILEELPVANIEKPLQEAINEGATALFGEKYGEVVRTVDIGAGQTYSYELCGGTHVRNTGEIGSFLILSEGSAAAGVRRIEAVTGREAFAATQHRSGLLKRISWMLSSSVDEVPVKVGLLQDDLDQARKECLRLRQQLGMVEFKSALEKTPEVKGVPVLSTLISGVDADMLRQFTDQFRQRHASGVAVLGTVMDGRPMIVAAVTDDLVKRGLHAGNLVKELAGMLGGSGGGRPNMAQAGGKDASRLPEALQKARDFVEKNLK